MPKTRREIASEVNELLSSGSRQFKSARDMSRATPKNPHIRRTLTIELTYIGSPSEAVRAAHRVLDAGTLQDGMLEVGSGFQILDALVKE
jgi:hypothetical protein